MGQYLQQFLNQLGQQSSLPETPGIVFSLLAIAWGCTSLRTLQTGLEPLAPGEGILVVHIHLPYPVAKLSINQATALTNLPKGEHLRLLALKEGSYHWSKIVVPADSGDVSFTMANVELFQFHVKAGRINYPGELSFRGRSGKTSVDIAPSRRNRSAFVLDLLRERYPGLLGRYPPIYSGPYRDDYLDYYGRSFLGFGVAAEESTP